MFIAKSLSFYKRKEVQELLIEHAQNKEVAFKFSKGFGKRPDVLQYQNDVLELAKKGLSSLHCSEELWTNPLQIEPGMNREKADSLREGWDLVIDLDCPNFEYSKIAAYFVIKALKYCNVKNISIKFSGNKGFHIGIPWNSFPKTINGEQVKNMFPEAPRKIAEYIKFLIQKPMTKTILKKEGNDLAKIAKKVKLPVDKIRLNTLKGFTLNTDAFIEMDTLLISQRHLYRMPYSLHEKSELISLPINCEDVLSFKKEFANPETAKIGLKFFDRTKSVEGEAKELLVRALDHYEEKEFNTNTSKKQKKEFTIPENAIPEMYFPPCLENFKKGLSDGKKRLLFAMLNFFSSVGWNEEQIRNYISEWNKKNREPLRDSYLEGQLSYHFKRKEITPPPNCDNENYYVACRICNPDNLCRKIKNPAQYAKIKFERLTQEK